MYLGDYHAPVLVVPSGWAINPSKTGKSRGGAPIKNGDLIQEGNVLLLECVEPEKIRQFTKNFIPLEYFIGKTIAEVKCIKGSRYLSGDYSFDLKEEPGHIYIALSGFGGTSQFFTRGVKGASVCEEEPDFDVLVKIGVFSKRDQEERKREIAFHNDLYHSLNSLTKERRGYQESLSQLGFLAQRDAYKYIESLEQKVKQVEEHLKGSWKWVGRTLGYSNLEVLENLAKPSEWPEKKVRAIHKALDSKKSKYRSLDVVFLEFEGGSLSKPISPVWIKDKWIEFSVEGLLEAGLISASDKKEAEEKFRQTSLEAKEETERRKKENQLRMEEVERNFREKRMREEQRKRHEERLREIKSKLKDFGLGKRMTLSLLEEKSELEKILKVLEKSASLV